MYINLECLQGHQYNKEPQMGYTAVIPGQMGFNDAPIQAENDPKLQHCPVYVF